ncbi:MAG TPA: hypothetical protein VKA25_06555 [Gemmatimonadales bacterium]|nr:hypothetical protein [Gemmatimonadales bacterium]
MPHFSLRASRCFVVDGEHPAADAPGGGTARSAGSSDVHNAWSTGSAQRGLLPCDAMVINAVLSLAVAVVMAAPEGWRVAG